MIAFEQFLQVENERACTRPDCMTQMWFHMLVTASCLLSWFHKEPILIKAYRCCVVQGMGIGLFASKVDCLQHLDRHADVLPHQVLQGLHDALQTRSHDVSMFFQTVAATLHILLTMLP